MVIIKTLPICLGPAGGFLHYLRISANYMPKPDVIDGAELCLCAARNP